MNEMPLWRVTYAIPGEPRVIGVVRAATGLDAIDRIEQVAANLQCVFDWPTAERIAADLADAGLLRADEPTTQT